MNGRKEKSFSVLLYFSNFLNSVKSAAPPGFFDVSVICEAARVFTHVKSQTRDLPRFEEMIVIPSGRFPSVRLIINGSSTEGIPAETKARLIMSFTAC